MFGAMRFAVLALTFALVACGSASAPRPAFAPSEVSEVGALPPGYVAGESLFASCTSAARVGKLDDEAFGNIDCSFERLSRVLRARAGELSATFIVGKDCRGRGGQRPHLTCSAVVARRSSSVALGSSTVSADGGPAPSPAQVLDIDDPRPQDADRIRVTFEPSAARLAARLPARAYDRVAETATPSVGRLQLGQVSARCAAGCSASSLRYALRVTAGRVGAGEVTGVKCFAEEGGARCVATALVPWSS